MFHPYEGMPTSKGKQQLHPNPALTHVQAEVEASVNLSPHPNLWGSSHGIVAKQVDRRQPEQWRPSSGLSLLIFCFYLKPCCVTLKLYLLFLELGFIVMYIIPTTLTMEGYFTWREGVDLELFNISSNYARDVFRSVSYIMAPLTSLCCCSIFGQRSILKLSLYYWTLFSRPWWQIWGPVFLSII